MATLQVLVIEDSEADASRILGELEEAGIPAAGRRVASENEIAEALRHGRWDLVVCDYGLPTAGGLEALRRVREASRHTPFVFVSGAVDERTLEAAVRSGTHEFVRKDELRHLAPAVRRAMAAAEAQREMEEALRAEERRFRRIFESAAVAQVELDVTPLRMPTGEDGVPLPPTVKAVNRAALSLFRATSEEALRHRLPALMGRAVLDALRKAMEKPGTSLKHETTLETLDEEPVDVAIYLTVPESSDGSSSLTMSFVDITERNVLQRQLLAAHRMEAVGQLTSGIAHDFNNLLTIVTSYADFLVEDLDPASDQRADAEAIRDAGRRATALVAQLLAFSRKQYQELRTVSLNEVVEGLREMLRRTLHEDIELHVRLEPDLRYVRADTAQMEQILINLVVNARDAMAGGGRLTVSTANAELDDDYGGKKAVRVPAGEYVVLAVSDTGTGIDAKTRARVFEPFFTTKGQGKGTGLGLAMAYGIVKQSRGFIWVYSEPGMGTTFKIYLPAVAAETTEADAVRADPESLTGTETVLLVEDDPGVRNAARRALTKHGYSVIEAVDGADALVSFGRHADEIQAVVTDLVMPTLKGSHAAAQLRRHRPDLPILFMSGYGEETLSGEGILDEHSDFISKPFAAISLVRKLRRLLDG